MAKDEKVGTRLPDNISKLNDSSDKMRSGRVNVNRESPIDSILSTVFREMAPTDPDSFDAKIIDIITDPDIVSSLLSTKLGRKSSGTERVYKIRADLYGHLEDPFSYDEGTKERLFYMSLHPDAFLDYGNEGAILSVGDLVECKYLHPKDRDGVLITEIIESSANAGSANRDMSTVAQDAVKGMFGQLGQHVGTVYDQIMGEPEKQKTKFRVPTDRETGKVMAEINGSIMTPAQIDEFGAAARLLVPNAVRMSSDFQKNRPHPVAKDRNGKPLIQDHNGIDLAVDGKAGHPMLAPLGGVIDSANGSLASNIKKYPGGNQVSIIHDNGYRSLYLHCETVTVKVGQRVEKGDQVATMGKTGRSQGVHLHYTLMTHPRRRKVDPKPLLMAWNRAPDEGGGVA